MQFRWKCAHKNTMCASKVIKGGDPRKPGTTITKGRVERVGEEVEDVVRWKQDAQERKSREYALESVFGFVRCTRLDAHEYIVHEFRKGCRGRCWARGPRESRHFEPKVNEAAEGRTIMNREKERKFCSSEFRLMAVVCIPQPARPRRV